MHRWFLALLAFTPLLHAGEGARFFKKAKPEIEAPLTAIGHTHDALFNGAPLERITLQEAIQRALANNLEAKFDKVGVRAERARVRFEAGTFDPAFSLNVSRDSVQRLENVNDIRSGDAARQERAITANQDLANAIRVSQGLPPLSRNQTTTGLSATTFDQQIGRNTSSFIQRTPWGMRYGFFVEANRLRSTFSGDTREVVPEYQTSTGIQLVQPLLKDFGPGANLANLRVARVNQRIAVMNWKQQVTNGVQLVVSTYYDMLFALADIGVRQEAIAAATTLVSQNQRRLDLGFMSPFDVQQARAQVSLDQEQLLTAKNLFMERQFALKRLISARFEASDARILFPISSPSLKVPALDPSVLLAEAFRNRFDYQQVLAEAEAQEIRLRFARNQLLPQLDVVTSYSLNGLAGDYDDSFRQAFRGDTPEFSLGVNVRVPFGFVQGRAQLDLAKAQKEQVIIRIAQTELTVNVDVQTVISRIATNRQRVATARQTRELYEEAVRIVLRRLDEGQASSFEVIEQQRRLFDSRSRELAADAELNKSITQLWLVTGTVLERNGIGFK